MRFLCKVPPIRNFSGFSRRLLCSIAIDSVTLHRLAAVSSKPPYLFRSRVPRDPTNAATARHGLAYDRFTVLSAVPFSFQFCGWELASCRCGFWLARWESNKLHAALPLLFLKGENPSGERFPCRIFGTNLTLDAPDFLQTLVISFFLRHSRPPSCSICGVQMQGHT